MYITPGMDKGWREKHRGVVFRSSVFRPRGVLMVISGIEHKMHGWDAICNVRHL